MAKRKRLTPASIMPPEATAGPLETKGLKDGWAGGQARSGSPTAPIADVAGSAATAAALDELAHELQSARANGRLVIKVALDAVDESYLVRDRAGLDSDDMDALKASLAARGQQTPIEVVDLGRDTYGLISGWRRLTALKALHEAGPGGGFGRVQCLIRNPDTASEAYIAMVEENEIRAPLNHYERARIAGRASEQGAFKTPREAAKALFGSVPRSKRSKIYSFLEIYNTLDDVLRFPQHLSEREGLAIAKALGTDEGVLICAVLRKALSDQPPETAAQERALLARGIKAKTDTMPALKDASVLPVEMRRKGQVLTLKGSGVDPAFEAELRAWLAARN